MKAFYIFIFSSLFIWSSCKKCNCEGGVPVTPPENQKLIIFTKDTILDFINQSDTKDTVNVFVSRNYFEEKPKANCINYSFSKSCICPSDFIVMDGYSQNSEGRTFSFSYGTYDSKTTSNRGYNFNTTGFTTFDSTNISKTINKKLISGLSVKILPAIYDSISHIYYKENLGLVSVVYKNGKRFDLK